VGQSRSSSRNGATQNPESRQPAPQEDHQAQSSACYDHSTAEAYNIAAERYARACAQTCTQTEMRAARHVTDARCATLAAARSAKRRAAAISGRAALSAGIGPSNRSRSPTARAISIGHDDWIWKQGVANRARWLRYIGFDDVVDKRNATHADRPTTTTTD
jgi:hypothetical protein